MNAASRGFAVRVDMTADARRVWRALTEPAALLRWCGPGSKLAERAGGAANLCLDRQTVIRTHVDIYEPQRRLRLIHLPGSVVDAAAGAALVDDLLIEQRPPVTVVRLLCSGLPAGSAYDTVARAHQLGWRAALARMKVYLEKRMDEEGTR